MELYANKKSAELSEGIITGIDDSKYDTLDEAIEDMETAGYEDDGSLFAYYEDDKIRVAWK